MNNDNNVIFKVDTGMKMTVLYHMYHIGNFEFIRDRGKPMPGTSLCGPEGARLTVLGKVYSMHLASSNERKCTQPVFTVKNIILMTQLSVP